MTGVQTCALPISKTNKTIYEFGPRDFIFSEWANEVQKRIKDIEARITNQDVYYFARTLKNKMNVDFSLNVVFEQNSPVDSFILGHNTLGRLRSSLDFEADCSDTGNHGTWTGTGIGGSQFTTSGWRLSAGTFNGSDRKITVSHDSTLNFSNVFSIGLAVKVSSLPGAEKYLLSKFDGTNGYAVRINSSNKVEIIYMNAGVSTVVAASTALTANTWQQDRKSVV